MAYLNNVDLVRRLKVRLNRPTSDVAFTVTTTDDVLYDALTEGQDELTKLIATYIPDAMIPAPTALTTADTGFTYTFGTDADSANIFPLGFFSVFATRADIPDNPLTPGLDYTLEGTKIRMLNNTNRSFADGGPWAQTIAASNVISSNTQPTVPVLCRLALLELAGKICCRHLGIDSSEFADGFNEQWLAVLAAVRTQAKGKYGANQRQRTRSSWYGWRR